VRCAPLLRAGLVGLLLALMAAACFSPPAQPTPTPDEEEESEGPRPGSAPTFTPRPLPTTAASGLKTELIAADLALPQSLAFSPDGRLFFVEVKAARARVLSGKAVQSQPVLEIDPSRGAEHGLVGLALDPGFDRNHYLYTFYTEALKGNDAGRPRRNRLTRWVEQNGVATNETPVLDNLPVGKCCHTGGKIAFASDGSGFLTFGDQGDATRHLAQDPNQPYGKLLHFDPNLRAKEGAALASLIYATGLRNPYGLDVHPVTGAPFITDNGPDMCDELNLGRPGANFGNPTVECSPHDPSFDDPIWDSGVDRLGVTGLRIYRGAMFPEFANDVLFCSVNTGNLMRAVLEPPGYDTVTRVEQVVGGQDGDGCRLDLAITADGSIYYASMTKIFRLYR
jgi:glucose/arabinose dehydrogenase